MRPLYIFTVKPSLPPELKRIQELARNLMWCWDHESISFFGQIDPDLWEETRHNPVLMLGRIKQERLQALAADDSFMSQLERAESRLDRYMSRKAWFEREHDSEYGEAVVAYFSLEFGLTESLRLYSGGLGVLAGDHLKSASDLGIPLVGVGLLYQKGYFRQYLNADGWQQESYPDNDFYNLPLEMQRDQDGSPLMIKLTFPGRDVYACIWRVNVGRIRLYLLDTNIEQNNRDDQDITDLLYGGDLDMRLKQELLIGVGGIRALNALGFEPTVYHMNEGHSAFLAIERVSQLMKKHALTFEQAKELARAGMVFTTHTPVPAGIDRFSSDQIGHYWGFRYAELGLNHDQFMALGRQNPNDPYEPFCMTILALRLASYSNGVSELHGHVSRQMFQGVWAGLPVEEVPIGHVTNGIHQQSWISGDMASLYERYLGPRWRQTPAEQEVWNHVDRIPGAELWNTHQRRRERMVSFVRRHLREQLEQRGASKAELLAAEEVLNPEALTIGFARRFATYKRATLLFRDPDRLIKILGDPQRPVQIIFSGKAHPHDNPGKELIRQIVHMARRSELRYRMVFLENYDMNIARYLVQGVDVWMNTPTRPHEASGTSGMKAAANGALNMSILDGWWAEAFTPEIGWAVGSGEEYTDYNLQDHVESNAIYNLLEKEVVPLFYERGSDGLPRRWVDMMKATMRAICPKFNTHRMLQQYTEKYYIPSYKRFNRLSDGNMENLRGFVDWKVRVRQYWPKIRIENVESDLVNETSVNVPSSVWAEIYLGELTPADVKVELYFGAVDPSGEIVDPQIVEMTGKELGSEGVYSFVGSVTYTSSGQHGFTVRVVPNHPEQVSLFEMGLVLWGTPK
ncbi:MAG: alpha-glucan family phosphorylase [Anaerolineae bacterium]|nr:alpha-glucan family phosphorylase [Anaerolineae bacterium]